MFNNTLDFGRLYLVILLLNVKIEQITVLWLNIGSRYIVLNSKLIYHFLAKFETFQFKWAGVLWWCEGIWVKWCQKCRIFDIARYLRYVVVSQKNDDKTSTTTRKEHSELHKNHSKHHVHHNWCPPTVRLKNGRPIKTGQTVWVTN